MIKNYLLITLRSMMKNKLFILVNIFGMAVALAQCIVGYFAYDYDANFDAIHKNRDKVYRVTSVREFQNQFTRYGFVPFPLGNVVDETFTDVEASARMYHSNSNLKRDNDLFPSHLHYVDPSFFRMFTFDFIAGNPDELNDKSSLFISETMAVRLFGSATGAMDQSITQVLGESLKELKVAGVFADPPMNSSFYRRGGSSYMNFESYKDEHVTVNEDDWKNQNSLYIELTEGGALSNVLRQLQPYIDNNNIVREDFQLKEYTLDPLTEMAHMDRADDTSSATWGAPPISAVIGSNVMAVLVILLACFNLTNTSIAISSRRLKEIGIRKVMGSMRKDLILQYLGETMLVCFFSLLLGLWLADLMILGWNYMWQYYQLMPHYLDNPGFMAFLGALLVVVAIVAGSYPAFYISRFNPVTILKGKLRFAGTNYFTRTLLALQFSISLISIVAAIGFLQNARFQRDYDLGFDVRGSVIAWVSDGNEFETYRNALQQHPEITSLAGARSGIFSNRINDPVKYESRQLEADIIEVGDNYLKTMDLKLLEGRDFIKDSETDQKESVIVTQRMADDFGWKQALGKEVIWKDTVKLFVIGVVKDVYTRGLWRELEPMMIRYVSPARYNQIVVSTNAADIAAVNEIMKDEWNKVFPNRLYNGEMLNANMAEANDVNVNIVIMFAVMGLITLLMSATGLFTLVSLNIIKRMKEIGVRKVLGASVANITRIVNTEFIIILLLASALGSWAGYVQSDLIMGSIWKYYQGPTALTFVYSVGTLFIVAFVAIGYKVLKAAMMNPVESLKEE